MKPSRKAAILFMRYPEPGCVKSRLAAAVGSGEAARIYEKLARRTLGVAAKFKRKSPEVDLFIYFTPPEKILQLEEAYPGPWRFIAQRGMHLGERMQQAIREVLDQGYSDVLLVGTDLGDLEPLDFTDAFEALENECAVLGPAADGGFYLIGLKRPCSAVFRHESWGSGDVFARTEQLLLKSGFAVKRLRERRDVDHPEDLQYIRRKAWFNTNLSIIVPTLGSSDRLAPFLHSIEKQIWPDDEIILVKAQSPDHGKGPITPEDITPKTLLIHARRGRGLQLGRGVTAAKGGLFLFLHDDSTPPPNFACLVREICEQSEMSLGCFQLAFSPSNPLLNGIARWANLRTRVFKLPYGDQGLFCRRNIYDNAGGFTKAYLMEDVDFVRRCRRLGRLMVLPERIVTSSERYIRMGIVRASLRNHLTMLLYHLGLSDRRLYRFYYGNQ
jgi:rSAM/selenodomain-associated transferase 2/rSAM/selenodomain-associated transferase 1